MLDETIYKLKLKLNKIRGGVTKKKKQKIWDNVRIGGVGGG